MKKKDTNLLVSMLKRLRADLGRLSEDLVVIVLEPSSNSTRFSPCELGLLLANMERLLDDAPAVDLAPALLVVSSTSFMFEWCLLFSSASLTFRPSFPSSL